MQLVLASGSPRRRELLARMGLSDFQVVSPDTEEVMEDGLPPERLVEALSLQKAAAVLPLVSAEAVVIAADTVVVLDGTVLGKPKDEDDARRMLTSLAGRVHRVYTGVTVCRGGDCVTEHAVTEVTFRPLTAVEIGAYIRTGEPMDKAGAYGIQGVGASIVTGVHGDFYNVMGLPVAQLAGMLARFGIDVLDAAAAGAGG